MCRIALVGDPDPAITAHRAIPRALEIARSALGVRLDWEWIPTADLTQPAAALSGHAGLWVVPGSPYANMEGVLAVIRLARESGLPFLGTCGGFQHAIIEFARNVAGITDADHAETASSDRTLVVERLTCSLVEKRGEIFFTPGSLLGSLFPAPIEEGYHCNYGPAASHQAELERQGLRFTGHDKGGAPRAAEVAGHRFFIGTLFQPERSALQERRHPLIEAFVRAVVSD